MTVNQKYSLLNRDNLTQPIQILLSEQQKANFHFFGIFEIYIKFEKFLRKG